jgi:hypothetical protein
MPVPGSRRPAALCDHEGVPRGTAARWKTRYSVRLTVPRRDGWRAWAAVRGDFERALSEAGDPAIATAEIASERRRGADYVRVTVVLTVTALDVSDALAIGWDAFTGAAGDSLAGWETSSAAAEVQPGPPLPGADVGLARIVRNDPRAERQRAETRSSAPIRRAAGPHRPASAGPRARRRSARPGCG